MMNYLSHFLLYPVYFTVGMVILFLLLIAIGLSHIHERSADALVNNRTVDSLNNWMSTVINRVGPGFATFTSFVWLFTGGLALVMWIFSQ